VLGAIAAGDAPRDREICDVLATIAARSPLDPWMRTAVLCGTHGRTGKFLASLQKASHDHPAYDLVLLRETGRLLALDYDKDKQPELIARLLNYSQWSFSQRAAVLAGMIQVWRNQGWLREPTFHNSLALNSRDAGSAGLAALLAQAADKLTQNEFDSEELLAAAEILGFARTSPAEGALFSAIRANQPPMLQRKALQSLTAWRDAEVADRLLSPEYWTAYPPAAREELLTGLLAAPETLEPLLRRLERGEIPRQSIDVLCRRQLTTYRDVQIRARAEALFGTVQGDRAAVYESFKSVADALGQATNGRKVFRKSCASCHRLNREGYALGPDLFGIRNQPKAAILLHLLVPDQEITQGFNAYTAVLKDGRSLQGLLASETESSVTLRMAQDKEETIPRDQIEEFSMSQLSLMPQGLETTITRGEMADLLAYLKGEAETESLALPLSEKTP
jgi:putative heme-binding domain-containing protein